MQRLINTLFVLFIWFFSIQVHAAQLPGPLVETTWLDKNLSSVLVLDLRKDVASFTKKPLMAKDKKTGKLKLKSVGGHIPGASLVNYKKIRVNKNIAGKTHQKLIPDAGYFTNLMQEAGVNKDSAIVIVTKGNDSGDMTMATPADGPSFGVAPSGTWMWISFWAKRSSSTPSSSEWALI